MKQHKNVRLWYLTTFFSYSAFLLPVWVIFNTEYLGLSNTQAFLLGVLPYGLSAFFEIPTGAWSDRYGRAKIYKLGTALYILSVFSLVLFKDFYVLFAFQIVGAIGLAMQSGGLEALVHDSLAEKDRDEQYASINGRRQATLFMSRVVTVLFSGVIYQYDPRAPILASSIMNVIGLAVSFGFEEVRHEIATASTNLKHMKETWKIFTKNRLLLIFLILIAVHSYVSEALFGFYQPYFKSIDVEISSFGFYYAIISSLSAIGAIIVARTLQKIGAYIVMTFLMLSVVCTLGLLLFQNTVIALVSLVPSSIAFGFIQVTMKTYIQKQTPSRYQATALSIASFAQTIMFFISIIMLGVLLDIYSVAHVNVILFILSLLTTPVFLIAMLYQKKTTKA
jgi:MFS family permease